MDNNIQPGNVTEQEKDTYATLSLIFGITGFFFMPVAFSIAAIVLGHLSVKNNGKNSKAKAGKICGIISLVLWGILICIFVYALIVLMRMEP